MRIRGADGAQRAHSWYPVCRGSLDDVIGLISVARLLQLGPEAPGSIEPHIVPATFVPETLTGMSLLAVANRISPEVSLEATPA